MAIKESQWYLSQTGSPDDGARLGAVLNAREANLPNDACLEWRYSQPNQHPCDQSQWLIDWLEKMRADVLVAVSTSWIYPLQEMPASHAGKIGFAAIFAAKNTSFPKTISGCHRNMPTMMHRAVQELHRLMIRNERGPAENPLEHVLEPIWLNGATLPPK